jgi:hypothetical protein
LQHRSHFIRLHGWISSSSSPTRDRRGDRFRVNLAFFLVALAIEHNPAPFSQNLFHLKSGEFVEASLFVFIAASHLRHLRDNPTGAPRGFEF